MKLKDESGVALVDAMAGILIVSLAVTTLVTLAVSTQSAIDGLRTGQHRHQFVHELAVDLAWNANEISTEPLTSNHTIDDVEVPVTVWRDGSTVHVAAPRGATADCTNPETADIGCVRASAAAPGHVTISPTTVFDEAAETDRSDSSLAIAVPLGATELRYVFRVTEPTTASFAFVDPVLGEVAGGPLTETGYYYGSVIVFGDLDLTFTGTVNIGELLVYEGPEQ